MFGSFAMPQSLRHEYLLSSEKRGPFPNHRFFSLVRLVFLDPSVKWRAATSRQRQLHFCVGNSFGAHATRRWIDTTLPTVRGQLGRIQPPHLQLACRTQSVLFFSPISLSARSFYLRAYPCRSSCPAAWRRGRTGTTYKRLALAG